MYMFKKKKKGEKFIIESWLTNVHNDTLFPPEVQMFFGSPQDPLLSNYI